MKDQIIKKAEMAAAKKGTDLGEELRQRGLTEATLATLLSYLHNVPIIDLTALDSRLNSRKRGQLFRPAPAVLALIPPELARQRKVLPLMLQEDQQGTSLTIAMENPGDPDTLGQIQKAVGSNITVRSFIALRHLTAAIEMAYPLPGAQE